MVAKPAPAYQPIIANDENRDIIAEVENLTKRASNWLENNHAAFDDLFPEKSITNLTETLKELDAEKIIQDINSMQTINSMALSQAEKEQIKCIAVALLTTACFWSVVGVTMILFNYIYIPLALGILTQPLATYLIASSVKKDEKAFDSIAQIAMLYFQELTNALTEKNRKSFNSLSNTPPPLFSPYPEESSSQTLSKPNEKPLDNVNNTEIDNTHKEPSEITQEIARTTQSRTKKSTPLKDPIETYPNLLSPLFSNDATSRQKSVTCPEDPIEKFDDLLEGLFYEKTSNSTFETPPIQEEPSDASTSSESLDTSEDNETLKEETSNKDPNLNLKEEDISSSSLIHETNIATLSTNSSQEEDIITIAPESLNSSQINPGHEVLKDKAQEVTSLSQEEKEAMQALATLIDKRSLIIAKTMPFFFKSLRGEKNSLQEQNALENEEWYQEMKTASKKLENTFSDPNKLFLAVDFMMSDEKCYRALKCFFPSGMLLKLMGAAFTTVGKPLFQSLMAPSSDPSSSEKEKSQEPTIATDSTAPVLEASEKEKPKDYPKYALSQLSEKEIGALRSLIDIAKGIICTIFSRVPNPLALPVKDITKVKETFKDLTEIFEHAHPVKIASILFSDSKARKSFQSILSTLINNPFLGSHFVLFIAMMLEAFREIQLAPEGTNPAEVEFKNFSEIFQKVCDDGDINQNQFTPFFNQSDAIREKAYNGIQSIVKKLLEESEKQKSIQVSKIYKELAGKFEEQKKVFTIKDSIDGQKTFSLTFDKLTLLRYELYQLSASLEKTAKESLVKGSVSSLSRNERTSIIKMGHQITKELETLENEWLHTWGGFLKTLSHMPFHSVEKAKLEKKLATQAAKDAKNAAKNKAKKK